MWDLWCTKVNGTNFLPSTSVFPCHCHSNIATVLIDFLILLLSEGQAGKPSVPSKKQCTFGYRGALDRNVRSCFRLFEGDNHQ
jgi:hypothetical protein